MYYSNELYRHVTTSDVVEKNITEKPSLITGIESKAEGKLDKPVATNMEKPDISKSDNLNSSNANGERSVVPSGVMNTNLGHSCNKLRSLSIIVSIALL